MVFDSPPTESFWTSLSWFSFTTIFFFTALLAYLFKRIILNQGTDHVLRHSIPIPRKEEQEEKQEQEHSPSINSTKTTLTPSSTSITSNASSCLSEKDEDSCCSTECQDCDCMRDNDSEKQKQQQQQQQRRSNSTKALNSVSLKILYGSQTGTAKRLAEHLGEEAKTFKWITNILVDSVSSYEPEELASEKAIVVFLLSTYEDGKPSQNASYFVSWLEDIATDFRVHKTHLTNVRYGIFGLGCRDYDSKFNVVAKKVDQLLLELAAKRIGSVGEGDSSQGTEIGFKKWKTLFWESLEKYQQSISSTNETTTSTSKHENQKDLQTKENTINQTIDEYEEDSEDDGEPLVDLEDLGILASNLTNDDTDENKEKRLRGTPKRKKNELPKKKKANSKQSFFEEEDSTIEAEEEQSNDGPREMLNPSLRKSLSKQGYKLLGSHSGVKLCRWTKAMLRGRGGCYKHTFYGITSYQCMEMTPSLACANKCVFCWRHHQNPVGKEWRWKIDNPEFLIEEAVDQHRKMIKQMKGVPGVVPERYQEAFTIRHCALSLVGEPIIYPHINDFVDLLHQKKISSFLVTNAQFPDKIENLRPVTQLYISVDAATEESLKKIDRPLFTDFWPRFLSCIDALSKKGQRTVFRLTLVKEWNMEEISNYAELVKRGLPDFVEVKGVTYCGESKASNLRMSNVPYHEEVKTFVRKLCDSEQIQGQYEIACEHEHSCCVLLARKSKFLVNGEWYTWINYDKFHELVQSGQPFTSLDYMEKTPSWALINSVEKGFDPEETRFKRKAKPPTHGC